MTFLNRTVVVMEIHRSTGQRLVLTSERSLHGHLFHRDEEDLPRSAGHAKSSDSS